MFARRVFERALGEAERGTADLVGEDEGGEPIERAPSRGDRGGHAAEQAIQGADTNADAVMDGTPDGVVAAVADVGAELIGDLGGDGVRRVDVGALLVAGVAERPIHLVDQPNRGRASQCAGDDIASDAARSVASHPVLLYPSDIATSRASEGSPSKGF